MKLNMDDIEALEIVLKMAEEAVTPIRHPGPCGPEAACDMDCVSVAIEAEALRHVRRLRDDLRRQYGRI